jgi:hypothetical protein
MKKQFLIIFLLACSFAHAQILPGFKGFVRKGSGTGGGGTNVQVSGTPVTATSTGQTTFNLTGVPSNSLLLLSITAGVGGNNTTIGGTPSLTWTKRADANAASTGDAEIWTAPVTTGGSYTVTASLATSKQSGVIYYIVNQETTFGTTGVSATAQSQPSRTVTTTRANSLIFCTCSDWNAEGDAGGTTKVYRDTPITESYYFFDAADHTGYHWYKSASTVTTYTEGLTGPNMLSGGGIACVEIRGN